jgi:formate dehydrogenase
VRWFTQGTFCTRTLSGFKPFSSAVIRSFEPAIAQKALEEVQALLAGESRQRDLLIEHLHKIQDQYQHISSKHLVALAHEMKLSPAEIYEVASFYHHFDIVKEGQTPPPPLTVRVCESLSCAMASHGL